MDINTKVLAFAARGKGVVLLQWGQAIEITKAKKLGQQNSGINQYYCNSDALPFEVFMINVKEN